MKAMSTTRRNAGKHSLRKARKRAQKPGYAELYDKKPFDREYRNAKRFQDKKKNPRISIGEGSLANPGKRRNPLDSAVAVSEEFHGRKVKEMIPVKSRRHHHEFLAELGELRKLVVRSRANRRVVTITRFNGAKLCANEFKNQLFIMGGDQAVHLPDFGIRDPHEIEVLGDVEKIEYFTDKEHLGNEGGVATYVHKFRTTNDGGRHVTVRMAQYPELVYYLRDEHLEFAGGSYEIKAEGIDK